jgi:hypothetical protein
MRVIDVGCGARKTTSLLYGMIQPTVNIVGVDFYESQVTFAPPPLPDMVKSRITR